ncbi:hypothetical protein BBSC_1780 [Bifidobacterium scardovii JCM 12489 = DSM 13734]|nr:hypothetical protein BBSC_1780 [Bifidobacterium scardovii JCM 12489 = DSM 13734]
MMSTDHNRVDRVDDCHHSIYLFRVQPNSLIDCFEVTKSLIFQPFSICLLSIQTD